MKERFDLNAAAPAGYKAMTGLQGYVEDCGLEASLLELVKIRASQINGCAFCLAKHTADARKLGETDTRMHLLNAWDEAPCFSARERAALAWTDALTLVTEGHVPDAVYESVSKEFGADELSQLSFAVVAINAWNRLAIATRKQPAL